MLKNSVSTPCRLVFDAPSKTPDLAPRKELVEAVITTLIFGVKSSSAQTEAAI